MTFFDYLVILRRRWAYLVLGVLAGAVGGAVTAPGVDPGPPTYEAFVTLLVDPTSATGSSLNLDQTALLVTAGEVPDAVERRMEEADLLPNEYELDASAEASVAAITITVTTESRELANRATDAAAEELVRKLQTKDMASYDAATKSATDRIALFDDQIEELNATLLGMAPDDVRRGTAEAELDNIANQRQQARDELRSLELAGLPTPPLTPLDGAHALVVESTGYQLPASRAARGSILGFFGLLLGIGGALTADRLDTRIRGKDDAERAFGLPVIAEIPPLPGGSSKTELLVATHPAAPVVEAFRALRAVLTFAASARHEAANGSASDNGHGNHCEVVLITSPMASEGKTTTAAHLAAVLAEAGARVLVMSADFRRPKIHEFFNVAREPGLADVLGDGDGHQQLTDLQLRTDFEGVQLLPSGRPVKNPANLLRDTVKLVKAAREYFDYIIIDSAPLLVANDATELASVADFVIVLARADRTSRDAARRTTEVLRRVDAPLLGAVVVAAYDTPTAYGYYRYRYYAGGDEPSTRRAAKETKKQTNEPSTRRARKAKKAEQKQAKKNQPKELSTRRAKKQARKDKSATNGQVPPPAPEPIDEHGAGRLVDVPVSEG